MKKYIGLTIFLIGTILASFWIAISSGKLYIKNKKEKIENTINKNTITKNANKEKEIAKEIQKNNSELENTEIEFINQNNSSGENLNTNGNKKNLSGINTENNAETNITESNIQINITGNNFSKIKEFIFIGLAQANLYTGDKYKDIFGIFELDNLPTYKVEGKEIYIKELNSIEYEDEKNIMGKLIQKIGGTIVETNMFGNKQLFVNPNLFYKKEVIMLVEYESKLYLVVLPYKLYKKYKKFFKEVLFVKS